MNTFDFALVPVWLCLGAFGSACQSAPAAAAAGAPSAAAVAVDKPVAAQIQLLAPRPDAAARATDAAPGATYARAAPDDDSLTLPDDDAAAEPNRKIGPAPPPATLPPEPGRHSTTAIAPPKENLRGAANQPASSPQASALAPAEAAEMQAWIEAIDEPHPNETFGEFVARVALFEVGKPYGNPPSVHGSETLRLSFRRFQCVSFIESTLSMARCLWRRDPSLGCFAAELTRLRYRGGRIDGYVSRLHYYEDWLTDNANKGLLEMMTQRLGGVAAPHQARYMTHHPELYGPLSDPKIFAAVAAMETRVSSMHPAVIARSQVGAVLPMLESGDVIAVTSYRPDILVSHTGFAYRHADGTLRMVHASSAKHRVIETEHSLGDYIDARHGRAGIMVARPIAPH